MTTDELIKNRYEIVLGGLRAGLHVKYKSDWDIFYHDSEIYQCYINPNNGAKTVHKSAVTLTEFCKFVDTLKPEQLKRIFGDTRLLQLQDKLTKDE